MKKNIGLFGGTFNPTHFGHLNLAIELKEKCHLDEVWVIPSYISPFRKNEVLAKAEERLAMVQLAFSEIPDFKILDLEILRPIPSYTIDTLREIQLTHPSKDFPLLLGMDQLSRFLEWKDVFEIIQSVPILIGSRPQKALQKLEHFPEEMQAILKKGIVETTQMEISATTVRDRLKKGLYVGHLVPAKVLDYICENQLYFQP